MKILSYNVRGLGGGEKRVEVRRLVNEKHPLFLCIQESKLTTINDLLVKSFWGDTVWLFLSSVDRGLMWFGYCVECFPYCCFLFYEL